MESTIYARLSTDATLTSLCPLITPTVPTADTGLPYLVYYVTGADPVIHLRGASNLAEYTIEIEIIGKYFDDANSIANRVVALLHCWQSLPSVQGSFLTSRESIPVSEPDQFEHLSLAFKIFGPNS